MAEVATTMRYRTGTATVTQGSTTITGQNTRWSTAGINPGANFYLDGNAYPNEIKSVDSDTQITLAKPYIGSSASAQSYSIDRNFQSSQNAAIAARQAALLGEYEMIRDGQVVNINGKDAYEVYVEQGGTKTRAQFKEVFDANESAVATLEALSPYLYHNAGTHNSHYRGKVLTWDDALSACVRSGTFGGTYGGKNVDMYVGDCFNFSNVAYTYLDENDEEQSATYSGTMRVADLDYWLHAGDSDFTTHHFVAVPDASLYTYCMNDENTTTGGYVGTKMRTVGLRRAEAIFKACFGADHILTHSEYLVNAVSNGKPSGGAWLDSTVELMDERQVYGSLIFDSGNPDGTNVPNRYSVACKQFNLFRHRPDLISNRQWYWLRNVVSPAFFAFVHPGGSCDSAGARHIDGVRPAALVA